MTDSILFIIFLFGGTALTVGLVVLYRYANQDERAARVGRPYLLAQQDQARQYAAEQEEAARQAEEFAIEYGRMQLQAELNAQALARYARNMRS